MQKGGTSLLNISIGSASFDSLTCSHVSNSLLLHLSELFRSDLWNNLSHTSTAHTFAQQKFQFQAPHPEQI